MRAKLYTALSIAFLLATCSLANAEAAGGVVYKSAAEIQAETPSAAGGKNADGQILTLDRAQVLYGRTVKSADTAEMHTAIDVIYYVISGHADVIAGGKFEGGHKRPPENEDMVGGKITGGSTYHLSPGDLLWMPAGTPHQIIVPAGETFTHLAIRHTETEAPVQ